jgi:hypothetical protein
MVARKWFDGCTYPRGSLNLWASLGAILTVIYSAEYAAPRTKTRTTAILPLLVILFIVSYGILTTLVIEQGQTIESQRTLIREMFKDSTQLAAMKEKLARDDGKHSDKAAAEQKSAGANGVSQGNSSSSNSAGSSSPAVKGSGKDAKRSSKSARTTKEIPGKPAADLEDVRRTTVVI